MAKGGAVRGDAAWHLAVAVGRGHLRDRRGLVVALLTPLGMLLIFWLALRDRPGLLPALVPSVVALAAMLAGSAESTRLVSWREQGVLARLVCTPLPRWEVVVAGAGAQALIGVGQGVLILGVGIALLDWPLSAGPVVGLLGTLLLGSACFTAYGALVAQLANRAESANALFIFSLLPMFLLGGALPATVLPGPLRALGAALPAGLLTTALARGLDSGEAAVPPLAALAGLLGYTALFSALAARRFRVE